MLPFVIPALICCCKISLGVVSRSSTRSHLIRAVVFDIWVKSPKLLDCITNQKIC